VLNSEKQIVMENRSLQSLAHANSPGADDPGSVQAIPLSLPSGDRLPPGSVPIVRAIVDREVTVGRELVAHSCDDRPVPVLVSAAPILKDDGSLAGAVMVCHEVSAMRELQRVREEWASIVVHELRQPISVIAVRCSLLLRGQLSGEQRDSLEQIARSVRSLGRMATDLMDASLLESDRLRVLTDRLDLGALLSDVVRRTPLAATRTRTSVPDGLRLFIIGDAQRLEQVIANLLTNAVKYATPESEILADLRLTAGQAHIRVKNDGDPIPENELPFVFNRFTRARAAGVKRVKGLGLGLYIAKGLVTAHHGRIWAESAPGEGTTFHIALPLDGPPVATRSSEPVDSHIGSWRESA
jgi:signal transduction histidine kinase